MLDGMTKLFTITRAELINRFATTIASREGKIEELKKAISEVEFGVGMIRNSRDGLERALKDMEEELEAILFLRDHVAHVDHFEVGAVQLIELRTLTREIELNVEQLKLAVDPSQEVARAQYNGPRGGRSLRT
jgi:hypothetical protein